MHWPLNCLQHHEHHCHDHYLFLQYEAIESPHNVHSNEFQSCQLSIDRRRRRLKNHRKRTDLSKCCIYLDCLEGGQSLSRMHSKTKHWTHRNHLSVEFILFHLILSASKSIHGAVFSELSYMSVCSSELTLFTRDQRLIIQVSIKCGRTGESKHKTCSHARKQSNHQ